MKKYLVLLFFILFNSIVYGTDAIYKETIFNSVNNSKSVGSYTDSWYNTTNGFRVDIQNGNNNQNGWNYIKFGRKGNASTGTIITNSAIDKKITKVNILIDALTVSKINSITLYTSSNKSTWATIGTFKKAVGTQTISVNTSTNLYYKIEFNCASGSSNGLIQISHIYFYANTEVPKHNITFIDKNSNDTSFIKNIEEGEYTIEKTIPNYKIWDFEGWSPDTTDYSKIQTKIQLTKDTVLYAFYKYGNSGYKLVEEDLDDWSGEYLIVNEDSLVAFDGSLETLDVIEDTIHVNILGNIIKNTIKNENSQFIISKKTNGYSIKSSYGKYIGRTSNTNGLDSNDSDIYLDSILYNGSSVDIKSSGAYLRYNSNIDQNRFRFFKSSTYTSQKPIQLYKRTLANLYCTNPINIQLIDWQESSVNLEINGYDSINIGNGWSKLPQIEETGVYNILIANLTDKSCTDLVVKTRKENRTDCINIFKIPIFITEENATNASINNKDSADCDLVILSGGKLSLTDNLSNKNITVYEGAHLTVPKDIMLNANTLTFRRLNDSIPSLSNNGTINLTQENGFFFDLRTDSEDWRWVALPGSHKVSDIKTHNGKDINLNTETFVSIYDGEYRSTNYRGAWKDIGNDGSIDTTFNAGEGFLLGANLTGRQMRTYRFTFNKSVLNNEKTSKSVNGMRAWGCGNESLTANHKGWNMAGNPYMDYLEMDITEPIQVGKLIKDIQNGHWTGSWVKDDESVTKNQRYIVVPSKDEDDIPSGGYKSILLDDCEIKPFTSFFVQIGGNESDNYSLNFTADKRVNNAPSRERRSAVGDKELFLRLKVGNKKLGCFIENNFSDEFEPGDDLESQYSIYQLISNYKLLYSAINDSIIESGVKIFANTGDRVELDNKTNTSDFEEINALYKGKWYNLLYNETFNIEDEKYFILQAKRRLNNIATGIYNNNTDRNINKIIIDGNVYIKRNNTMFNIFGEQIR